MTAAVATLTTVQNAVVTVESNGQKPTIDRIVEVLGGGSRGTIIKHLATIRGANKQSPAEPDVLTAETRKAALDYAEALGRSQRALAEEAFIDERRSHLETVGQMVADAQRAGDMLETIERDAARYLARVEELERELAAKTAECLTLAARLEHASDNIATLEQLLKEADTPRLKEQPLMSEIAHLMRGLDARLSSIDHRGTENVRVAAEV